MANQLLVEQYRVYDANGFPIPGALLYTYVPGTTTPRTVYTDSALSVASSNPVVADASGTFVPLYSSQPVKINVTDASGNAVPGYPRDHAVSGVDSDDFRIEAATVTGALAAGSVTAGGSAVYTRSNAIGTVSFSGINTGALYEAGGSDLDGGYWEKRASGWFTLIIQKTASSGASQTVNFPSGLVAVDNNFSVQATAENISTARFATIGTKTTTSFAFIGWTDAGNNAVTPVITFTVTGRWR